MNDTPPSIPGFPGWELQHVLAVHFVRLALPTSIPGFPGWELQPTRHPATWITTYYFNPRFPRVGTATCIAGEADLLRWSLQSPVSQGGNCNSSSARMSPLGPLNFNPRFPRVGTATCTDDTHSSTRANFNPRFPRVGTATICAASGLPDTFLLQSPVSQGGNCNCHMRHRAQPDALTSIPGFPGWELQRSSLV